MTGGGENSTGPRFAPLRFRRDRERFLDLRLLGLDPGVGLMVGEEGENGAAEGDSFETTTSA